MSQLKVAAKAILHNQGKVLIVSDANDRWDFPGGGIVDDESLPAALARELNEELGFTDGKVGALVCVEEWSIEKNEPPLHVVGIFYEYPVSHQFTPTLSDENMAYAWIFPNELASYSATSDTMSALKAFIDIDENTKPKGKK